MVYPLSAKELPECLASVHDWQYEAAKGGSIRRQWSLRTLRMRLAL